MKEIPRIDLKKTLYKDFMKNNKVFIWQKTIDGIEELYKHTEIEDVPVFVLYGSDLKKPKEFIIKRDQIDGAHLDKAIRIMESNEEYEYCTKIIKIKNDKKGKK